MTTTAVTPDGAESPPATSSTTAVALSSRERKITMLRPIAEPAELMQVQNATREYIKAALVKGRDYGDIPGVSKPSLFQPGAERICTGFGVLPRYRIVEKEVDHHAEMLWRKTKAKWETINGRRQRTGEEITEGKSLGLYRYVIECELYDRTSGEVVGTAIASCSSLEAKYCDRPREAENTVLQMAEKRAFVRATRTTFGLSEMFTQDVEDNPDLYAGGDDAAQPGGSAAPAKAASAGSAAPEKSGEVTPPCPICAGRMYDNRATKRNPRAPDFKCRDRSCDGVVWPPKPEGASAKGGTRKPTPARAEPTSDLAGPGDFPGDPGPGSDDFEHGAYGADDIPF